MLTLEEIFEADFPSEFGTEDGVCDNYPRVFSDDEVASGMSKFVIFFNEEYVIKVPFNGEWSWSYDDEELVFDPFYCQDYCAVEAEIYDRAYNEGLEMFFASTEFIGNGKCGKPFYKSERVLCLDSDEGYDFAKKHNPSQGSKDKANKHVCGTPLPFGWLARAYEYYEEALVDRLLEFIDENNIDDLHDANLGFRKDGAPVLLDYSGFNS